MQFLIWIVSLTNQGGAHSCFYTQSLVVRRAMCQSHASIKASGASFTHRDVDACKATISSSIWLPDISLSFWPFSGGALECRLTFEINWVCWKEYLIGRFYPFNLFSDFLWKFILGISCFWFATGIISWWLNINSNDWQQSFYNWNNSINIQNN